MSVYYRTVPSPSRTPRSPRTRVSPDLRRRQLLDAATWVFARQGYRRASIAHIIARAGIARGTFYLYFAGKQQVFLAIVEDFHARVNDALHALDDAAQAARAEGPRAVVQASVRTWLEFFAARRDATRVVLREAGAIDPRFEQGVAALRELAVSHFASRFRTFQQIGAANSAIDARFAAHLQLGMFDELLNAYVLNDEHADLDRLATQLADFEWSGIQPPIPEPKDGPT
jgi:TetR/AcrR family transcriptional regulator, fatty acid metabolism regulator protein